MRSFIMHKNLFYCPVFLWLFFHFYLLNPKETLAYQNIINIAVKGIIFINVLVFLSQYQKK